MKRYFSYFFLMVSSLFGAEQLSSPEIKNVIFDLFGVLIDFKEDEIIDYLKSKDSEFPEDAREIFWTETWYQFDMGMPVEEVATLWVKSLEMSPEEQKRRVKAVVDIVDEMTKRFEPLKKGLDKLAQYKKDGKRCFILSNIGKEMKAVVETYPVFKQVDGVIFSCDIGMAKPHADIFEYALKTYNLKPEETLFVDDRPRNVKGAQALGIQAELHIPDGVHKKEASL